MIKQLLAADAIPVGMELFPASDRKAWEHIKKVIDDCDYYVLILAGKYGSIIPGTKTSYTEAEYDYARSRNIPTIALLHSDLDKLPSGDVDSDPATIAKRNRFRTKVMSHLCKFWTDTGSLTTEVLQSYMALIREEPRNGWTPFTSEIEECQVALRRLAGLGGLTRVTTTHSGFYDVADWEKHFSLTEELDVFYTRGHTWWKFQKTHLDNLGQQCSRMRFILPDFEDSKTVTGIALRNGRTQSSQRRGIESAVKRLKEFRASVCADCSVKIYLTKRSPSYTLYRFSQSAICSLYTYADVEEATDWAAFTCERDSDLYRHLENEIKVVLEGAREV